MRLNIIVFAFLLKLLILAQDPNHNAVLITGETPMGAKDRIEQALEEGEMERFNLRYMMSREEELWKKI